MNLATAFVLALILAGVFLSIRTLRRGESHCCGTCSGCCQNCPSAEK